MRSILLFIFSFTLLIHTTNAQVWKDLMRGKQKDSSKTSQDGKKLLEEIGLKSGSNLNTTDVVNGLKEALTVGATRSTEKLSATDGFFGNAAIKILLPPEAKNAEKTLRALGMGKMVDDALLSINRAAEDATKSAATIFIDAVKKMTLQDAWGILYGADTAATAFMRSKTTPALTAAFRPVIAQSIEKVDATKYWNEFFGYYNRFAAKRINPNLEEYVTEKALSGIFLQLANEEQLIRKNPVARSSELLKKVFDNPSATKN